MRGTAKLPLSAIKGMWRDQVFGDRRLTPSAFKSAYALADYITMRETREKYERTGKVVVFPSQARLSDQTGLAMDTVRAGIRQLIDRRHLEKIERGNQFTGANRYRIVLK